MTITNNQKDDIRNAFKISLGIKTSVSKNNCKKCFYHPVDNICNKHHIRTENNDACDHFKKDTKFKFVSGGTMSPR